MIEIRPIQLHQVEAAKRVIATVCREVWQWSVSAEEVEQRWDDMGVLADMDDLQAHYVDNHGLFLVIVDEGRVVGTGAIMRLDDDTCELKRMWVLQEYRGHGLGRKLAQLLLDFARRAGYKRVRLDVGDAERQERALKLYKRLGFYCIERYNDGPCTVFMEKTF